MVAQRTTSALTENNVVLIAFDSTHAALASEKMLHDMGAALIPTPREITASCGMSLRIAAHLADEARSRIQDDQDICDLCAFYTPEKGTWKKI